MYECEDVWKVIRWDVEKGSAGPDGIEVVIVVEVLEEQLAHFKSCVLAFALVHISAEPSTGVTAKPFERKSFESRPEPQPRTRMWAPG